MHPEDLQRLVITVMPYGKYKGRLIANLSHQSNLPMESKRRRKVCLPREDSMACEAESVQGKCLRFVLLRVHCGSVTFL